MSGKYPGEGSSGGQRKPTDNLFIEIPERGGLTAGLFCGTFLLDLLEREALFVSTHIKMIQLRTNGFFSSSIAPDRCRAWLDSDMMWVNQRCWLYWMVDRWTMNERSNVVAGTRGVRDALTSQQVI